MDTKALDPKALQAAATTFIRTGRVPDAITAYLAALAQPAAPSDHVGLVEHFKSMQAMATAYLTPETYVDRTGKRYPEPDNNHTENIRQQLRNEMARAFAADMIYMLDGPEEREAIAAPSDHAGLVNEERLNAAADVLARDGYNVLAGSIREAIAALSGVGPVAVKPVTDELGGSTTAYTREQLAKLAFAVFYSSALCAPENIAAVIKEIDCCPGCDHANGSTCHVSERGDYCPNDLANDLRQISAALYGPRDPDHYVASVFGPDKMAALATPPAQGDAAQGFETDAGHIPGHGNGIVVSIPGRPEVLLVKGDEFHLYKPHEDTATFQITKLVPAGDAAQPGADGWRTMVERAFRDGVAYATTVDVVDVDLAWETSKPRPRQQDR